jgi:hypothetical protein
MSLQGRRALHAAQRCAADVWKVFSDEVRRALAAGEDSPEVTRRLSKIEEKRVQAPLLRLRQACCHPQVRLQSPRAPPQLRD